MLSPVHANFGLAESNETAIKRKGLFSYTDLQNGECEEMHRGSFGFSEYPLGKQKNIQKEEQERAVKELISGNDVSSLQDFEILRFVTYVHLPCVLCWVTRFVASLVFMKGTSCCARRESKVE